VVTFILEVGFSVRIRICHVLCPGVDDEDSARLEMPRVAGHEVKPVPKRGRRQEPVNARDDDPGLLGTGRELAPKSGRLDVDREDPVAELGLKTVQPRRKGLLLLAGSEESDALGNLAQSEDADVEVGIGDLRDRRLDPPGVPRADESRPRHRYRAGPS
jgi:hypothetical protein